MPEEMEKKEERDDADAGTLLKTVIDRLDSLHKRMDAMEEEKEEPVAADKHKKDSEKEEEKEERKDAKEKDEDDSTVFYRGNKAPKPKSDKKKDDDSKKDDDDDDMKARRKDDDDSKKDDDDSKKDDDDSKHRKDARRMKDDEAEEEEKEERKDAGKIKYRRDEEEEERDDSRADASDIRRRIDKVERMLPKQLSDSDRAAFSDAQARADDIYHAFGSRAPQPMQGETLMAYRQRLTSKLKEHSSAWKDVNIYAIADDKAFEAIEKGVYADALKVAQSPATAEPGTLRMITEKSGGHEIHKFVGEPRAWMDSMAGPVRMNVTHILTPNNNSNGSAR